MERTDNDSFLIYTVRVGSRRRRVGDIFLAAPSQSWLIYETPHFSSLCLSHRESAGLLGWGPDSRKAPTYTHVSINTECHTQIITP
jgi:hypothetical protein